MVHTTPTKVLLTTTFQPLVAQLSGSLAHGVRLLEQFCHCFEGELHALLREVGRRLMAWVLNHMEPENDAEAPSRVCFKGRLYCRRGKQRSSWATLFGPVAVGRRLYAPLERGPQHPFTKFLTTALIAPAVMLTGWWCLHDVVLSPFTPPAAQAAATGPLRVLASNPRYFTDGSGKAIYLTGSHTCSPFAV